MLYYKNVTEMIPENKKSPFRTGVSIWDLLFTVLHVKRKVDEFKKRITIQVRVLRLKDKSKCCLIVLTHLDRELQREHTDCHQHKCQHDMAM